MITRVCLSRLGVFSAVTPIVLNVGFYNFVSSTKILALVRSDSAPMRRVVQEARKGGTLIDATQGRKTKSVVFLDGGFAVASALSQETLARRLGGKEQQPLAGTPEEDAIVKREQVEADSERPATGD
ncbi:MAG: DUF370 domain-containing protein [Akkermansiaceae bacterium]|nr:DUF370 domain-containing protein [Armatimonadota bacterium]